MIDSSRHYLPYGNSRMGVDIPDRLLAFTGEMQEITPLHNIRESIIHSLDNPVGTPPLCSMAAGKSNIVFLVEDNTRETPLALILPVVVNYLNSHGVKDESISFLTAPGTHRTMSDGELLEKLGEEIVGRFRITQHDAAKSEDITDIGSIDIDSYSIPVHINRYALAADLLIGFGNIVPHCNAGYSGGGKIVLPGISDFASTSAVHAAAAFCPGIPLGVIEGNPCRHAIEGAAKLVGLDFILNVVMNCNGMPAGIFSGDFIKAHRAGVLLSEQSFKVSVETPADIVIVSSYPADMDFWQAGKGLSCAYHAVKPGGIIILAAPCYEGLAHNHDRYRRYLDMSLDEICDVIRSASPDDADKDIVAAAVAAENCRIREKAEVFIISEGLTQEDIKCLKFTRFASIQSALDEALKIIPAASIGILPKGGISLPVLTDASAYKNQSPD